MARKRDTNPKPGRSAKRITDLLPKGYEELLGQLKERIRSAQLRAAAAVNRELIELYWQIGQSIVERQRSDGWGKSIVERLAQDLQAERNEVGKPDIDLYRAWVSSPGRW